MWGNNRVDWKTQQPTQKQMKAVVLVHLQELEKQRLILKEMNKRDQIS